MMEVRRVALSRFGESAIKLGEPLATMEEVLLPLYLHHRYQVEAAASVLGGQHYIYAMRGDGRVPFTRATAAEQRAALKALMDTIAPSALALPENVVKLLPPRPDGYGMTRELFPRYTGMTFDVITPAVVAATHTFSSIFQPDRARPPRRAACSRSCAAGSRRGDRPGGRGAGWCRAGGLLRVRDRAAPSSASRPNT